jgi:hypothetical protein
MNIFSEICKASTNVYTVIFYFLQSIEIGLQLNIEKTFSYGTAGSTLTVFEIAVVIL